MKKLFAIVLAALMVLSMVACGNSADSADDGAMTYAVEAGSAGEAVANEKQALLEKAKEFLSTT